MTEMLFLEVPIINLEAFNKRYDFFSPSSWKVYLGANRNFENKKTNRYDLNYQASIALGYTYDFYGINLYSLLGGRFFLNESEVHLNLPLGLSYWFSSDFHISYDFDYTLESLNNKFNNTTVNSAKLITKINNESFMSLEQNFQENYTMLKYIYKFN